MNWLVILIPIFVVAALLFSCVSLVLAVLTYRREMRRLDSRGTPSGPLD